MARVLVLLTAVAAVLGAAVHVAHAGPVSFTASSSVDATAPLGVNRTSFDTLVQTSVVESLVYKRLAEMTDRYGGRPSGSEALEKSIEWIVEQMKKDDLDTFYTEPVKVGKWVRGKESLTLLSPREASLHFIGLGESLGTAPEGITAEVIVITSFVELAARAKDVRGKIVLYNVPFTTYGSTVTYRTNGASEAAKYGALATLTRSITPYSLQSPHTGFSRRTTIPGGAVSVEDAELMSRLIAAGEKVVVHLKMDAKLEEEQVISYNVVAERRGWEKPDEIVTIGGHIDSWDNGNGVLDDAGGAFIAWETVRLLSKLQIRPRRTIRAVLWTDEETGGRGADAHALAHIKELEQKKIIFALESDEGLFTPRGIGFSGSEAAFQVIKSVGNDLLSSIGAGKVSRGGSGADIEPLCDTGVPCAAFLSSDDKDPNYYFYYHHTDADTITAVTPENMALNTAAMAGWAFAIADLAATLPR